MRYTSILGCGFLFSVFSSAAGAIMGFYFGETKDLNSSCHKTYPDYACDSSHDENLPLNWTIDGAIIGFSIPVFLSLCYVAAECKGRSREEGTSCFNYLKTNIANNTSSLFSVIKDKLSKTPCPEQQELRSEYSAIP